MNTELRYARYITEVTEDISSIIQDFGCQPILFIGSGLSKRYFGAPNWDELLTYLLEFCPLINKGLGFYKQAFTTPLAIGEEFAAKYQEWAWTSGSNIFPEEMFGPSATSSAYIKYQIAEFLNSITPKNLEILYKCGHEAELDALRNIKPHAIITTNYDRMLEILFPDLEPIIGQKILKAQPISIGEIYKIHGCITDRSNIVFTQSDYDIFAKKKKFLSAKLLTFFKEHPLIFIGYSATDPNIKSILSDIDEALPEKGGIIPNVFILEWNKNITSDSNPAREKLISTEDDRVVRVKLIEADNFEWVFRAFSSNPVLNNVNPRVLRALIARAYQLVRYDIPKSKIEANFEMLTSSVSDSEQFSKLFGIATVADYSAATVHYKYSATQIGIALGGAGWHLADRLMKKLKSETGIDIKAPDNIYHRTELVNKSHFNKYSEEAIDLLKKVRDGLKYEININ